MSDNLDHLRALAPDYLQPGEELIAVANVNYGGKVNLEQPIAAAIAIPPSARCRAISRSSIATLATSSPFAGSSSSHKVAPLATTRASAARRRCPVESRRTGTSAIADRATASSASTARARARDGSASSDAQKASASTSRRAGHR